MNALRTAVQAPARTEASEAPPLSLEDRLVAVDALMTDRLKMAAAAVDVNTAVRVDVPQPVDLADVVRVPEMLPRDAVDLYPTRVAALLQRAQARMEADGWCSGATVDQDGARCLYGAIRAEAAGSRDDTADALAILREAIRRRFPDADTVPSFNDAQHGPRVPVRLLGEAATLAHARNL
ncbi:hypothetical protein ACIOFV_50290 [Streptomyces mirabilis]|uniref:DUF6197 family protein n=1 Tax=Streptomyces mirabilis TaxID=68239 RepID=UPI00380321C4